MVPGRSWEFLGGPGRSWEALGRSWGRSVMSWVVLGGPGRTCDVLGGPGRPWEVMGSNRSM